MLYSLNNKYPTPIPFRIFLSNGKTRTDPSTFTEEEIADAGYKAVSDRPPETATQRVWWDTEVGDWVVQAKTEEEMWYDYMRTVPKQVTMRQARLALLQDGLLTQVNDLIAAMEGTEGEAARIEWEYAQEVRRDSELVIALASMLELTEQQVCDLFLLANTL
jgi:adenosyl cobinamide kinase/adenosyl cobinamide phosphate guanylyltransferase